MSDDQIQETFAELLRLDATGKDSERAARLSDQLRAAIAAQSDRETR